MKVDIIDRVALHSMSSSDVLAYLRVFGWDQGYLDTEKMAVYRKNVGDDVAEVIVPLRRDLVDYDSAMHSLLRSLADVEGRSQLQVFNDVQNVNADIVRVRVENETFADGSIPLEAGSRLVDRAVDLLIAGACAADNPRPLYAARRSNQVSEFLKEARLGQSERGSYIVTMKAIVPPVLIDPGGQGVIPDPNYDEPFERRVTRTLATALAVTRAAITQVAASGSFAPIQEAVASGVSANLLESILGLISETGAAETEVAMTWSPTRVPDKPLPSYARFSTQDEPILQMASHILRERSPKPDHRIEGIVRILQRDNDKAPGTITVRALIDGRARTVRMRLKPEDYRRAVDAHGEWNLIGVTGELVAQGKLLELRDPREFQVFEPVLEDESTDSQL